MIYITRTNLSIPYIMGQSNFPNGMGHIANGINENPKTTLLIVALSALLFVAMKDKNAREWLLQNNPTNTTQDSASVAAAKQDDEIAASSAALMTIPY